MQGVRQHRVERIGRAVGLTAGLACLAACTTSGPAPHGSARDVELFVHAASADPSAVREALEARADELLARLGAGERDETASEHGGRIEIVFAEPNSRGASQGGAAAHAPHSSLLGRVRLESNSQGEGTSDARLLEERAHRLSEEELARFLRTELEHAMEGALRVRALAPVEVTPASEAGFQVLRLSGELMSAALPGEDERVGEGGWQRHVLPRLLHALEVVQVAEGDSPPSEALVGRLFAADVAQGPVPGSGRASFRAGVFRDRRRIEGLLRGHFGVDGWESEGPAPAGSPIPLLLLQTPRQVGRSVAEHLFVCQAIPLEVGRLLLQDLGQERPRSLELQCALLDAEGDVLHTARRSLTGQVLHPLRSGGSKVEAWMLATGLLMTAWPCELDGLDPVWEGLGVHSLEVRLPNEVAARVVSQRWSVGRAGL